MTLLQNTLGRNYKWIYIILYNFRKVNAGLIAILLSGFPKILNSLMVLLVWSKANPSIDIFTYLIIGRIYKSFCEGVFDSALSTDIVFGSLTSKIIQPQSYFSVSFAGYIGRRFLINLIEVLTFVITAAISIYFFSPVKLTNFDSLILIILFIPISFFANFAIGYFVGSLAFFIRDKREYSSISDGWFALKAILFGLIVPLDQLPFHSFFEFLPTSYFLHHPMQIYLGKYDSGQIIQTFVGGVFWCLVLWIIARLIFKAGLKKNEAVGL